MSWFDSLVDSTEDAINDAIDVATSGELPPFGAGVRASEDPERIAPGGPDDPLGQAITEAFEAVTGVEPQGARDTRIRGLAEEYQDEISQEVQSRIETDEVMREEIVRQVEEEATMPVSYDDWVSIAFDVAKSKGATFNTTQEQIRQGNAPSSEAISVFADIWNDRKDEMTTRSEARRIAREEIDV